MVTDKVVLLVLGAGKEIEAVVFAVLGFEADKVHILPDGCLAVLLGVDLALYAVEGDVIIVGGGRIPVGVGRGVRLNAGIGDHCAETVVISLKKTGEQRNVGNHKQQQYQSDKAAYHVHREHIVGFCSKRCHAKSYQRGKYKAFDDKTFDKAAAHPVGILRIDLVGKNVVAAVVLLHPFVQCLLLGFAFLCSFVCGSPYIVQHISEFAHIVPPSCNDFFNYTIQLLKMCYGKKVRRQICRPWC